MDHSGVSWCHPRLAILQDQVSPPKLGAYAVWREDLESCSVGHRHRQAWCGRPCNLLARLARLPRAGGLIGPLGQQCRQAVIPTLSRSIACALASLSTLSRYGRRRVCFSPIYSVPRIRLPLPEIALFYRNTSPCLMHRVSDIDSCSASMVRYPASLTCGADAVTR